MYPKRVIRYISGKYSPEDEEFVRQWLAEDPARRELLDEFQTVWDLSGELDWGDENRAWNDLKERVIKEKEAVFPQVRALPKRTRRKRSSGLNIFLRVAAVILIVAGAYGFYRYSTSADSVSQPEEETVYNTISSPKGEQVHVRIKDGTKVVLNASSQIHYRNDYGTSSREIYLEGEAYFEVNHDHPVPFVVHAKEARVEDIGTKFNIKAYPGQQETEVAVSEGKVRVSPRKQSHENDEKSSENEEETSVVVSQGQKVNVRDNPNQLIVEKADLHQVLSWLQNRLIFDAEPLAQVIDRLERYYDIEVDVADASLFDKKITGSFEDESMENVVKVLAISMDAGYSLKGNAVRFFIEQGASKNAN